MVPPCLCLLGPWCALTFLRSKWNTGIYKTWLLVRIMPSHRTLWERAKKGLSVHFNRIVSISFALRYRVAMILHVLRTSFFGWSQRREIPDSFPDSFPSSLSRPFGLLPFCTIPWLSRRCLPSLVFSRWMMQALMWAFQAWRYFAISATTNRSSKRCETSWQHLRLRKPPCRRPCSGVPRQHQSVVLGIVRAFCTSRRFRVDEGDEETFCLGCP